MSERYVKIYRISGREIIARYFDEKMRPCGFDVVAGSESDIAEEIEVLEKMYVVIEGVKIEG